MVRHAVSRLFVALATAGLFGCAARAGTDRAGGGPPASIQFTSDEQRLLACLDLRDHVVEIYADAYVEQKGLEMSGSELAAFRNGWAEELAKKGTFERFEESCFTTLTPRKYRCGMASQTTDGLVACMRLSAL